MHQVVLARPSLRKIFYRSLTPLATALLLATATGCASTTPSAQAPPTGGPPITDQVAPVTVVAYPRSEVAKELERGAARLLVEDYAGARTILAPLETRAEALDLKAAVLYHNGLATEGLGELERALTYYRTVANALGTQTQGRAAAVRVTRVLTRLERWNELGAAAAVLLGRADLSVMDQIEGYGAQALAHIEQGKTTAATISIAKADRLIEKNGLGRSGVPPFQLAQIAFAEGELRRIKSEAIKLTPVPDNFGEVLEARCQGLLNAQSAYTEAMRSRDAHWSAMSGYRVGQLYQQLHREAMAIPAPDDAPEDKRPLFEAAMRLRYRILVEKGLKMMQGTVRLGERTGDGSAWVKRAEQSVKELRQSLADEDAALKRVPYTEKEIRAALALLTRKAGP